MPDYILLVEDDELDLSFTTRALRLCSVEVPVRVARDGEEVLAMLDSVQDVQGGKPVLILLDLRIPKVDGFTILKHIRRTPAIDDIPVIVVSGSLPEADRVRAMLLGANNCVVKAFEFAEFAQQLALALLPYAGSLNVGGRSAPPARRAGDRLQA